MQVAQIAVAVFAGGVSLALIRFALKLMFQDPIEYQKSRARYPSAMGAVSGKARVKRNHAPDGRVRAGIVFNSRQNRIEANGKIRNDIVDSIA